MRFFVFNNSIPSERGMSGSDRRALEYSRYFAGLGHEVTLILPRVGVRRYEGSGVQLLVTDDDPRPAAPAPGLVFKRLSAATRACAGLRLGKGDVLYSSSDLLPDSLPAISLKRSFPESRLVCGMHLLAPHPFKGFMNAFTGGLKLPGARDMYYFYSQRFVTSRLRRYADLVLVSNHLDRERLLRNGFPQARVMVAYGAVDLRQVSQAGQGNKEFDAVFVGRFHEQKGISDLLETVRLISTKKQDFRLALISDIDSGRLYNLLDKKKIGQKVEFFGFKDGVEKFSIMKKSRLLIFPSYYESFGMVILEAMACGLPVVAYDLPVYDGIYTAGLVRARLGDTKELARLVLKTLTDSEGLAVLSSQALGLSVRFSWEGVAEQILKRVG